MICKEGEDLATAFYVIGGQISVTMKTARMNWISLNNRIEGDDKLIAMLGPGAVVGTELLIHSFIEQFYAVASKAIA